jgi:hypothetical protein
MSHSVRFVRFEAKGFDPLTGKQRRVPVDLPVGSPDWEVIETRDSVSDSDFRAYCASKLGLSADALEAVSKTYNGTTTVQVRRSQAARFQTW